MCGIVGYIGDKSAEPILIDGLRRLEYRGYDSAGFAFLENEKIHVVRAEGKLDNVLPKLRALSSQATVGIGHTRWATHGKPSEVNAHPHQSKDVVLVHNGIIENHLEIKNTLSAKGFHFVSDTDTEVVCHLIQDHLNCGDTFLKAFQNVLLTVRGAFSFVAIHRNDPHHIYAAKRGSPLVVGEANGASFVASDIPALLNHTREMYFLEDGEMVVLSRDGVQFSDFNGVSVQKKRHHIAWTAAQAEKGGFKHFMLKEIMEQPRALSDTLRGRIDQTHGDVHFEGAESVLQKFTANPQAKLQIVACGTSWHSGLLGKLWIESLARMTVNVDLASEFRYRDPLVDQNTLLIAISQSGETADTLAAVQEGKKRGATVLSICNVIESSIPRASHATLYTYAGPEIGVASTKAFITQMAVLYLLALKLAKLRRVLGKTEMAERLQMLVELPSLAESFLQKLNTQVEGMSEKICRKEHCYFLGRGLELPIILEGALKLKEISYVHAEGYAGGEMKHGPIALIEDGTPVVAVMIRDALYEKMQSSVEEILARGAQVFSLISADDETLAKKFPEHIRVPKTHPDLHPFLAVLPLQMLSYQVADKKGTDVDQPRNLAKSVTVE